MKNKKILMSFLASILGVFTIITPAAAENENVSPNLTADETPNYTQEITYEVKEEYPVLPAEYSLSEKLEKIRNLVDSGSDSRTYALSSVSEQTIACMKANLKQYYTDYEQKFTEMDKAADEIVAMVDPSWTDLSKVIFINDYLTSTKQYDTTYKKYCAYDLLVNNTAVCQGYAEAFWYLMYKLDIECRVVTSTVNEHGWNLVKIDGQWYNIDTTWNDPTPDKPGRSYHTNFLLSDSAFSGTGHKGTDWVFGYEYLNVTSAVGYATSTKYENYSWKYTKTPIVVKDNKYYFISYIPKDESASGTQEKYIIRADQNNNTTQLRSLDSFKWYVWGSTTSSWNGVFSGFTSYGDKLIYNDPTHIYSCDLDGTNQTQLYTLSSSDAEIGYIYGFTADGNYLKLILTQNPNNSDYTTRTIDIGQYTPPALPKASAQTGSSQITLSWNAVNGAQKYEVRYRLNGSSSWSTKQTTSTSCTLTGLTGGSKYDLLVLAYNGYTYSSWSDSDIICATPAVPAAPLPTVTATPGNSQVKLSWNTITGATNYKVCYRKNGTSSWTEKTTTAASYTVTGLVNGTKYDFVVVPYNGYVWSEYTSSDIINATPIPAKLSLPTVTATPGNSQVKLSWNTVTGASNYKVCYRKNGTSSWTEKTTPVTSYTVTGLVNGTKYDFVVVPYNGYVWSDISASAIVNATPVPAKLPVPTPTAAPGDSQMTLTWNAVSGAEKYMVCYGTSTTTYSGAETSSTSYTVTGLTNEQIYYFAVQPYNGYEWSDLTSSDFITAIPKPVVLPLPTVTATAGDGKVTLSWNDVGADEYRVDYSVSGANAWTSITTNSTSATVTGLINGTEYQFIVVPYNGYEWSDFTISDAVNAKPVPPQLPLPDFTLTPGDSQVKVTWNEVPGSTQYLVAHHKVTDANNSFSGEIINATTYTFICLENGTEYEFIVRPYNGYEWTDYYSSDTKTATPVAKLPLPTVTAKTSKYTVSLTWNDVGAVKYRLFYRKSGENSWAQTETSSTRITITGLVNGTKYDFVVVPYNGYEWSEFTNSDHITAIPMPAKLPLPTVTATTGDSKVTLSWNDVGAEKYRIYYSQSGETARLTTDTTSTSATITGLLNGTKYDFVVVPHNGYEWSEYTNSDFISAIPMPAKLPLPTVKATPGDSKVTLSWNDVGAVKYHVNYSKSSENAWMTIETTDTSATITELANGTKYNFVVVPYNGYEWTTHTNSDYISATPVALPLALPEVKAVPGDSQITLTWSSVQDAAEYKIRYINKATGASSEATSTNTKYVIKNLENGNAYDVIVLAVNNNRISKYTNNDYLKVVLAPSTPTVKTIMGANKVDLSWNKVPYATKYKVGYRLSGTTSWTEKETTSTSYSVTGLSGRKTYEFRVLAYNGTLWSKDPVTFNQVYVYDVPALPIFAVKAGDSQVEISMHCKNSGYEETTVGYRIYYRPTGTSKWKTYGDDLVSGSAVVTTVTGLTNGQKYDFIVLATNCAAWSKWTDADIKTATPTQSAPALPAGLTLTPGDGKITASWNAVKGASYYTVYTYYNGKYTKVGTPVSTKYTISGLTNGTKYGVLVLATNSAGSSSFTKNDVKFATPVSAAKPALPTGLTLAPGNGTITASWNAVSGASYYTVYTYYNGKYTKVGTPVSTKYTISGLTNGTKYGVLVLATNSAGSSSFTKNDVKFATPVSAAKPALPTGLTLTPGNGTITASWNAVSGASYYTVYTYYGGKYHKVGTPVSTKYTITGLTNGTKYGVLVLANNATGSSAFTKYDVKFATPVAVRPALPTGLKLAAGNGQITAAWDAVSGASYYTVYTYYNGKYHKVGTPVSTKFTITGLTNGTKYGVLVLATNSAGSSEFTKYDVKFAVPAAK